MTPEEVKSARAALGLTQIEFARAFRISPRAIAGWEQGTRNGRPHAIPAVVALLVGFAVKYPNVRRELGIRSIATMPKLQRIRCVNEGFGSFVERLYVDELGTPFVEEIPFSEVFKEG